MKRQRKALLWTGMATLLIGVVLTASILLLNTADNGGASEVERFIVIDEKYETIVSLSVSGTEEDFTVNRDESGAFGIEELSAYPPNEYTYDILMGFVAFFESEIKIEEPEDLEQYGLNEPSAVLKAKFNNENEAVLRLGSEISAGGVTGRYCMRDGDNSVYVLNKDASNIVFGGLCQFVSPVVFAESGGDDIQKQIDTFVSCKFTGTGVTPFSISKKSISYNGKDYSDTLAINEPYDTLFNDEKIEKFLSGVFSIGGHSVVAMNPTSEQIRSFGLDEPTAKMELVYNKDQKITVSLGKKEGDKLYCMSDKYDLIYLVEVTAVEQWYKIAPKDVMSTMVVLPFIYEVKQLIVELDGETRIFEISGNADDVESLEISLGGKKVTTADFQNCYSQLLSFNANDTTTDSVKGYPRVFKVTYVYKDSSRTSDVLEFYDKGNRRFQVSKNGGSSFIAQSKNVEKVMKSFSDLINAIN